MTRNACRIIRHETDAGIAKLFAPNNVEIAWIKVMCTYRKENVA